MWLRMWLFSILSRLLGFCFVVFCCTGVPEHSEGSSLKQNLLITTFSYEFSLTNRIQGNSRWVQGNWSTYMYISYKWEAGVKHRCYLRKLGLRLWSRDGGCQVQRCSQSYCCSAWKHWVKDQGVFKHWSGIVVVQSACWRNMFHWEVVVCFLICKLGHVSSKSLMAEKHY